MGRVFASAAGADNPARIGRSASCGDLGCPGGVARFGGREPRRAGPVEYHCRLSLDFPEFPLSTGDPGRWPDPEIRAQSLAKYRKRAAGYDATCGPTWPIRERTVAALQLQPGQRVLDVGCGTGLSLALLRAAVGVAGVVYGFDQSPEMLGLARARVHQAGWTNVHLFEVPAQGLSLPEPVDALFFHYTHDILRSPSAVAALLACARPGAAVAIAGIKYFPGWLAPLNAWVYLKNRGYNGAPGELRSPWDRITPNLADWRLTPTQFGMGYIGTGRVLATQPQPVAAAQLAAAA